MTQKQYKITLDLDTSTSLFDQPDTVVNAKSPKEAAAKYAGCPVTRHYEQLGGSIVVEDMAWPHKRYLYDRGATP